MKAPENQPYINAAYDSIYKKTLIPSFQVIALCSIYLKHTHETVPKYCNSFAQNVTSNMSSIVPVSDRPSRLFIEAFFIILEGIALLSWKAERQEHEQSIRYQVSWVSIVH